MRITIGYLAILLGGAGVILGAAGVLVWPVASAVDERTEKAAAQADEGLTRVKQVLARVEGKVTATTTAVEKVRASAARVADRTGKADRGVAAKVDQLLTALGPLLERADGLAESLWSVAALLESAAGLTERFGKDKARAERLRAIARTIGDGASTLDTTRGQIAALQRGEAAPTARAIADLAGRVRAPLEQFASRLAEVRQETEGVQEEVARLRREVAFWTVAGPVLLDVLLIWFALGQLCLIGWGRRQVAARPSTP
jgi:transcriptional regulator with XRE-family HTH domain